MALSKYLLLILLIGLTSAVKEDKHPAKGDRGEFAKSLFKDCVNTYSFTCLKLDVVSWVDKLNDRDTYDLFPGVSIVKEVGAGKETSETMIAEAARSFPNNPEARLNNYLLKKVQNFLNTHTMKLKLWSGDLVEEGRGKGGDGGGFGGGGGKKGKGGGYGGIIAMGAMMKGMMLAMAIAGTAAIAGKALMTALISLILSAVLGAKSYSHGDKHSKVEIYATPHEHGSRSDYNNGNNYYGTSYGGGGWSRSLDTPLPLGLQPHYKPV